MECRRCGEFIADETTRYCPRCGQPVNDDYADVNDYEIAPARGKGAKWVLILLGLVVVFLIWNNKLDKFFNPNSDKANQYIEFVKNGTPTSYPDTTYGQAFSDFFSNEHWEYFRSDDGKDVVEFTGNCMYRNAEVEARIQFVLNVEEGTFEFEYLDFNGVPQIQLIKYALITKVFEGE
jgi:hypothetical protein